MDLYHDDHPDLEHPEGDNTVLAKVVAMCVLFLASMTLGLLPVKLIHWFKWTASPEDNIYVKLLLCLGGGVLLCTTFLHVLPEVAEKLTDLEDFPDIGVPFAELLMCLGFFTIYFVEECAHLYIHKKEKDQMSHLDRVASIRRATLDDSKSDSNLSAMESQKHSGHSHNHSHSHSHGHSHVDHSHVVIENSTLATIRGLLVVLALSVHELFEGLSVGLESETAHVWYMFGAVSAHKLVIAFCIGVELVASRMRTLLIVIYVFTFAVVSPLGIGIGILVSEDEEGSTATASVILQGLASGTLLYVVFFEILREERKSGIKQWLAVFVGFAIMVGVTFIDSHEH